MNPKERQKIKAVFTQGMGKMLEAMEEGVADDLDDFDRLRLEESLVKIIAWLEAVK